MVGQGSVGWHPCTFCPNMKERKVNPFPLYHIPNQKYYFNPVVPKLFVVAPDGTLKTSRRAAKSL